MRVGKGLKSSILSDGLDIMKNTTFTTIHSVDEDNRREFDPNTATSSHQPQYNESKGDIIY